MPCRDLAVPERYVIGIDGGASKTVGILGDSSGKIIAKGTIGPSNFHNIGIAAAQEAITSIVSQVQRKAHLSERKLDFATVALAGVDSSRDKRVAERFVGEAKIARRSMVVHDSLAALEAAFPGGPGIIVISGTGCVAAGMNEEGAYFRAGGWGYLVDDEGSAYDIGRKGLRAAFRAIDGRSSPTKLVSIFKHRFRVRELGDALNKIYSDGLTVEEVGRLALLVSDALPDGACKQILNDAGISLAELACCVASKLNMGGRQVKVAIFGGTFKSGKYLLNSFKKRIRREYPLAEITQPRIEPALGAFWLAVSQSRLK